MFARDFMLDFCPNQPGWSWTPPTQSISVDIFTLNTTRELCKKCEFICNAYLTNGHIFPRIPEEKIGIFVQFWVRFVQKCKFWILTPLDCRTKNISQILVFLRIFPHQFFIKKHTFANFHTFKLLWRLIPKNVQNGAFLMRFKSNFTFQPIISL